MMPVIRSILFLFAGALLGWWLHGLQAPAPQGYAAWSTGGPINPPAESAPRTPLLLPATPEATAPTPANHPPTSNADPVKHFSRLLDQQYFDQALAFYEQMLSQGSEYQALLKPSLLTYSQYCVQQCSQGAFVALADTWLSSYYDDIPMLLLLAEYQRQQGFYEEAANVLNLALTYAYQPGQREQVAQALRQLVQSTDDYFSAQQRWLELLGFYEYLDAITLSEPAYAERQAMISELLGETEPPTEAVAVAVAANAVPLTRQGDHYLVQATLNDRQNVVLMIDTGASVTSLSLASFKRLDNKSFRRLGSRMFKTANGLAQGEVYRSDSIALGENRSEDIEIAVLDYQPAHGVDGLLGMNVLRNYGFEIDQDKGLLYLRPR